MASILVVDDDPTIHLIAAELLRASDHAMVEAGDGVEGIALFKALPVDLVVLDMLMPNRDGLETLLEMKALKPHVPILAISSGGRIAPASYLKAAMTLGADAALEKPLRLDTFRVTIDRLLAARPGGYAVAS